MMDEEDRKFQREVRDLGCIICLLQGHPGTPCEIHHILSGGRRISEMAVLGLCPGHHRGGNGEGRFISRHPFRMRFERAYGTESELIQKTREQIILHRRRALVTE